MVGRWTIVCFIMISTLLKLILEILISVKPLNGLLRSGYGHWALGTWAGPAGESNFGWALSRLSPTWKWNQVERGSYNTLLWPATAEVHYYRALRPHALRALHNYFYCACALIVSAQVVRSTGAGMRTRLRNSAKCTRLVTSAYSTWFCLYWDDRFVD